MAKALEEEGNMKCLKNIKEIDMIEARMSDEIRGIKHEWVVVPTGAICESVGCFVCHSDGFVLLL